MSIFDVARYLSYSKSVDHFDGSIRSFDLQKVDCKRSLNDIIEKQGFEKANFKSVKKNN
tara:strand:- start:4038 stop:4214 length:177 start_codon:yes stop_codon:yes gene_type:complete